MCLEIIAHLVIISERRLLGGQGFLGAGQDISVCTVFRGRSGCILALWPAPFSQPTFCGLMRTFY